MFCDSHLLLLGKNTHLFFYWPQRDGYKQFAGVTNAQQLQVCLDSSFYLHHYLASAEVLVESQMFIHCENSMKENKLSFS
jgi:hypothetical protein